MVSLSITPKLANLANLGLAATGNARAMLMPAAGGLPVTFTLNPRSVSLEKSNKTESERGVITHKMQDAIKATSNVRLKLKDAHLTGALVTQASIDALIGWATPEPMTAAEAAGRGVVGATLNLARQQLTSRVNAAKPTTAVSSPLTKALDALTGLESGPYYMKLPILHFMWGVGGPLGSGAKVNLEKVDVDYQRFDGTGIPIWAKVSLTLVEYTEALPFTNPTSGGVPGRTRHVVTQGEGVVQIATRAYGSPGAWRRVAEANGLDDPLRVRPGRSLDLPPAGEAP